jgi:hypothetical protein
MPPGPIARIENSALMVNEIRAFRFMSIDAS